MSEVVIDTNVLMVANEEFPPEQADEACVRTCLDRLVAIQSGNSGERVVLDTDDRLIGEYGDTLKSSHQPSTGHAFLYWLYQVGWNPSHCDRIAITCRDEDSQCFDEFPEHDGLADFDVSDRKFVAVTNAHPAKPPILQAVDTKWITWEQALSECGLRLEWLCPETANRLYQEHLCNT